MDERCKALWEKLSAALKPQVSSDTYKRWFSAVELTKATEDSLTFRVPNNIYQFWIESNHLVWAIKYTSRVMYLSSELFINEFIDAIQHNALVKFLKRYRQADLLLIGDIQFLGGKERSQEEFFHTFNTLFDGHKQIVLSSDRPASEIANLEHRLVSRFEWGLTAELQPPAIETRLAILRKKADAMQIKLHADVFQFLASRIRTNVRRLEGALMRVASFASLSGRGPSTCKPTRGRDERLRLPNKIEGFTS